MALDLPTAASFFTEHSRELNALGTIAVTVAVAEAIDLALAKRGRQLTQAVAGGELSPVADTRLRLVRRLVFVTVIAIGVAVALSSFDAVRRGATAVLASSAVLGLVVGFAARQTLANAVAGILLAITQPLRIGDLVTFEDRTGTVEDVRLTYTYLRGGDGRRIIVPNERLAQSTIENHTIVDPRIAVEVSVWLPRDADVGRAVDVLGEVPDVDEVLVADVERDGVRLVVKTWASSAAERETVAARVRAVSVERLRNEGLSSTEVGG